jgi:general secretion pathway protein F
MTRFAYRAVAAGGALVEGEVSADTREAAIARIRAGGAIPVEVKARGGGSAARCPGLFRRRRAGPRDAMVFVRQLALMLGAGTPLDRALEIVERTQGGTPVGALAREVLKGLRGGEALSDAMARRAEVFTPMHLGMVRAGEAGGALAGALDRLAGMLERNLALREAVRSALTYPLLVLILTGVSLVVLMVYVVPEFRPMFEGAGGPLPLSTRIVVAASDFTRAWGLFAALGAAGALMLLSRGLRSRRARRWIDRRALGLPLWGGLVKRVETARFCRTLGALAGNGVPLLAALDIAAAALGNTAMGDAARRAGGPLSRGEGLAAPLATSGIFPDMALQLMAVGEESGRLPQMLEQVADVYERETAAAIQRMLALLTPTVTIGLGALIAFVIGAILSAILGSYNLAL